MYQESIAHLFWHFQNVARFWRQLKKKFGIQDDLSIKQVICGDEGDTQYIDRLNLLLLIAKQFIWNYRVTERPLTFRTFMSQLQQYSRLEKHVAQIDNKLDKHNNMWGPLIAVLDEECISENQVNIRLLFLSTFSWVS